ncbi:MAG: 50S ribosomal protein L10 [Myxococcota bacterium]
MNSEQKAEFVEKLHSRIKDAPFVVLTGYKGSSVAQLDAFRRGVEEGEGTSFQVVKNTLARRAVEGTDKEALADHFKGPIGVVISGEDPIAAAKVVKKLVKDSEHIETKVGFFEGDVLDAKQVESIAELPSKEELQAKLLASLLEAPRMLLRVLQAAPRDLLYLLRNYADKLEKENPEG